MKKICSYLIFFLSIYSNSLSAQYVEIKQFKGGVDKFRLSPIKYTQSYRFLLTGTSYYNELLFDITKINTGISRRISVSLNARDFKLLYYFKDGEGEYNITIFGTKNSYNFTGLCTFKISVTNSINSNVLHKLYLNEKIVNYVEKLIGKKIGRGECWDLAQYVLDHFNADWSRPFNFGVPYNYKYNKIQAGDIVQMYDVVLEYNNRKEIYGSPDHTAIVYKVNRNGLLTLAHQNVFGKRYVILSKFDPAKLKKGHLRFYRPVSGFIEIR